MINDSEKAGKLKVFSFRRCPFAIRVRMTLHEKGLKFETIEEDLKNISSTVRHLHPEAKVPVLVHDDVALYESAIITEYLEEKFPDPPLMPETADERAQVRLWTYWCNHVFKPAVDRYKYGTSRFAESEIGPATESLWKMVDMLESQLSKSKWLVGDAFSLADIHVFPFFRQFSKTDPEHPALEKAPCALQWLESILARDTFAATIKKVKK